jgi:glycosyltransferase involved in cell wall biosynthesis
MRPSISVVIPTHNRPDGLRASLGSILRQSSLPDEVVVVDDGSSPAVDESIFEGFSPNVRCVLLTNVTSRGGNNARNQGVVAASGEFIAFLDDDDQFKEDKIKVLMQAIASNPDADVLYHPAHIHMPSEGVSYFSKPYRFNHCENVFHALLIKNCIGGTSMVTVRRKALINVGLFDERMPALQDYELWLRFAKEGCVFHYVPAALTDYEQSTGKSSITKKNDSISRARALIEEKYASHLSPELRLMREEVQDKTDILRFVLNDRAAAALKISLQCIVKYKKAKYIQSSLSLLFGRRVFIKLYSWSQRGEHSKGEV